MTMAWLGACLLVVVAPAGGVTREYYIAAEETDWDFAPSGRDVSNVADKLQSDRYLKQGPNRVGHVYKKAVYIQYTDATFTERVARPAWLGMTGPILRAELGDTLVVTFFNNASREYSMHPHGLFYLKNHEGSLSVDGTSGVFKTDDIVMPRSKYVYNWHVTSQMAPAADDPNCISWVYHSHINPGVDSIAGLMGVIVTCRPGMLNAQNVRTDVDREYALVLKAFDENISWYARENMARCENPKACLQLLGSTDKSFGESNIMHAINGRVFGHLEGLEVCVGETSAWYIVGMGNEVDVHSLHFHGQLLDFHHRIQDTMSVFPAISVTASMRPPVSSGRWLLSCMVNYHLSAIIIGLEEGHYDCPGGMTAFLSTKRCPHMTDPPMAHSGNTRHYFLAAEEVTWNYGPSGIDKLTGRALTDPSTKAAQHFTKDGTYIGGEYKKAHFVSYTDSTYTTRPAPAPNEQHLGILGPVLRAEEGDALIIQLRNDVMRPVSLQMHGLQYLFNEDGTFEGENMIGVVHPGVNHTYYFHVPGDIINPNEPPCAVFLYYSAHDPISDVNTGLIGPLVICRPGELKMDNSYVSPRKEFFMLFTVFDENLSWYLDVNIRNYTGRDPATTNKDDANFVQSNLMYGINGYSFSNLPGLEVCLNQSVTWYVLAVGTFTDVHSVTFDGSSFLEGGRNRDVEGLVPGSTATLFMRPDSLGTWMIRSEADVMKENGMHAVYLVRACTTMQGGMIKANGVKRQFYIAAEEMDWDFALREQSIVDGSDLNDPRNVANIFVRKDKRFIGDTYKKAVFRGFTDPTFTHKLSRTGSDLHLDLLGPVLHAEVGDVIEVVFKNLASRPFSMHPHGLFYDIASSGTGYNPDSFLESSSGIQPGMLHIYHWHVPERAGPGPRDPDCITWLYTSSVDFVRDTQSGLMGPIVVCRKGTLTAEGKRKDVDREFFIMMSIINENNSWYIDDNIARFAPTRVGTNYTQDRRFIESNEMHSVNGRLVGNNQGLVMKVGDIVAWNLMATGSDLDVHTFHFHGHTVLRHAGYALRSDVIAVFPGDAEVVEMRADNAGTWLLHCHVMDHIMAGMETAYTVLPAEDTMQ